jgi:small subunit ribosomal protein S20
VANIKSAAKRARQAEKRRQRNVALRSSMRTAVKKAVKAVSDKAADAAAAVKAGGAAVDRVARKGLIHPNKAARHKQRLNKALKLTGTTQDAGGKAGAAKTTKKAARKKKA